MEERIGAYRVLVGKREGKRSLGRPSRRCKDIKLDVQELGWRAWSGLIWLRTGTGYCECGNEPSGSINCGNVLIS
jgi:hypothetical protein